MPLRELTGKAPPVRLDELDALSRDPLIRDALVRLSMDILVSGWVVRGSSDNVALFVRHVLNRVWTVLVMESLQALKWGTSVLEVVWDIEDVRIMGRVYPGCVVPVKFLRVPLQGLRFLWDEERKEIRGVRYKDRQGRDVELLDEKVLWYSHMPSPATWPRGVPLILSAKAHHDMFQDILDLLAAYVENIAIPPIVGYCPPGTVIDPVTGMERPAGEYLAEKLQELRASGIMIIPMQYDTAGQPLWRVDFPGGIGGGAAAEIARILDMLRTLEAESIYPPTQQAMIAGSLPSGLAGYVFREFLMHLNDQLVKHLVYLNWGEEEWAYVEAADQSADINLVRDIVRSAIQFSEEDRRRISKILDWYALLQMFGLPISMEEKKEEAPEAGPGLGLGLLPGLGLGLGGLSPLGGLPPVPPGTGEEQPPEEGG